MQAGHVLGLQSLGGKKYPSATSIRCYSHKLNLAKRNVIFYKFYNRMHTVFNSLSALSNFVFSHFTVRANALKDFMERKLPGVAPTIFHLDLYSLLESIGIVLSSSFYQQMMNRIIGQVKKVVIIFFLKFTQNFLLFLSRKYFPFLTFFLKFCKINAQTFPTVLRK